MVPAWPLSHDRKELLEQIATLIRRFGSARFLATPLARADERDFPDRWEPTLTAVHQVLYRLTWLAHIDPEIVVVDARAVAPEPTAMLRTSQIAIGACSGGVATFHVANIGNDDVAGSLAHQVGEVFLHLAPGEPFRSSGSEITDADGSVAAIYLGLGVIVANATRYARRATKLAGGHGEVISEQHVAEVGGLSIEDATLLVAVQDLLRDEAQEALTTLLPPQRDLLEHWREILDPHEDELRMLLGIADAPELPVTRAPRPRTAPTYVEPNARKFNREGVTFRVEDRSPLRAFLGLGVGALGFAVPVIGWYVGAVTMLGGAVAGWVRARRAFVCADPNCTRRMDGELAVCPGCGGRILETIAHANLRLERLEAYEEARGLLPAPETYAGE